MPLEMLVLLAVASIGGIALCQPRFVVPMSLLVALGWATIIPFSGAPTSAIAIGLVAIALVLSMGWTFGTAHRAGTLLLVAGVMLLLLFTVRGLLSGIYGPIRLLGTADAVLLMLVASRMRGSDLRIISNGLSVLVLIHVLYAGAEILWSLPGVWPMSDGSNDITERTNTMFPDLPGRAMSSFSHPIPLAYFLTFASALLGAAAIRFAAPFYWVPAVVGIGGVLLTGTRSAVLVLSISMLLLLLFGYRRAAVLRYLFAVTVSVVVSATVGLSEVRGLLGLGDQFEESASYLHRRAVVASVPQLLTRDVLHIVFGWGTDLERIFDEGIVGRYSRDMYFFDNQFVATLVQVGLVGLVLYVILLGSPVLVGDGAARVGAIVVGGMSMSFDLLDHFIGQLTFMLVVGMAAAALSRRARAKSTAVSRSEHPAPPAAEHLSASGRSPAAGGPPRGSAAAHPRPRASRTGSLEAYLGSVRSATTDVREGGPPAPSGRRRKPLESERE